MFKLSIVTYALATLTRVFIFINSFALIYFVYVVTLYKIILLTYIL